MTFRCGENFDLILERTGLLNDGILFVDSVPYHAFSKYNIKFVFAVVSQDQGEVKYCGIAYRCKTYSSENRVEVLYGGGFITVKRQHSDGIPKSVKTALRQTAFGRLMKAPSFGKCSYQEFGYNINGMGRTGMMIRTERLRKWLRAFGTRGSRITAPHHENMMNCGAVFCPSCGKCIKPGVVLHKNSKGILISEYRGKQLSWMNATSNCGC